MAVASLLPDLIDKPLKWFLFPNSLGDDHVFGHTLLLPLLILLPGLHRARRGDVRLALAGLAALTHITVDPVLLNPRTLFWPLLGLRFRESRGIPGEYQLALDILIALGLVTFALLRQRGAGGRDSCAAAPSRSPP